MDTGRAHPAFGGAILVGLHVVDFDGGKQRVQGLELPQEDLEVGVDEDIRWADGAVRLAVSMQPGEGIREAMGPVEQDRSPVGFG